MMDLSRVCTETIGFVTFTRQNRQPISREPRDLDMPVGLKKFTLCRCCSPHVESRIAKNRVATTFLIYTEMVGSITVCHLGF